MVRPNLAASSGVSPSVPRRVAPSASSLGLGGEGGAAHGSHAADSDAAWREALVGIVGAKREPVFGAAREHAVRLGHAAGDEVIDHDPEIAVGAAHGEAPIAAAGGKCGVDSGNEPLPRGLLVTGRAVDLAGQEQARDRFDLEARGELARVDIVVFDGVTRPDHPRGFEPRDGRQEFVLNVLRQRGRDAVGVDGVVVETFGLEKDLVAVALLEAHHLVLDRGAIARADTLDGARVHRRAGEISLDDGVGRCGRMGDVAGQLRRGDPFGEEGEGPGRVIAVLDLEPIPANGAAVEAGRGAGLEPAHAQAQSVEPRRQAKGRGLVDAPGRDLALADMDEAAQEGAGGENHGACRQAATVRRNDAGDGAAFDRQVLDRSLDDF